MRKLDYRCLIKQQVLSEAQVQDSAWGDRLQSDNARFLSRFLLHNKRRKPRWNHKLQGHGAPRHYLLRPRTRPTPEPYPCYCRCIIHDLAGIRLSRRSPRDFEFTPDPRAGRPLKGWAPPGPAPGAPAARRQ